jgi:hypothetical protein
MLGDEAAHWTSHESSISFRKFREMENIRFLASRPGVDRSQIQSYFTKHGLAGLYDEI